MARTDDPREVAVIDRQLAGVESQRFTSLRQLSERTAKLEYLIHEIDQQLRRLTDRMDHITK